jgi:uncharacterized membrane protein YdjX (TVP38/TMEM64 family)
VNIKNKKSMEEAIQKRATRRKAPLIKAISLLVFIIAAVTVVRFTSVKDFFTPDEFGRFLEAAGIWAPVLFMLIYAFGVCLFLPGTLLGAIGAVLFGAYWGFLYV